MTTTATPATVYTTALFSDAHAETRSQSDEGGADTAKSGTGILLAEAMLPWDIDRERSTMKMKESSKKELDLMKRMHWMKRTSVVIVVEQLITLVRVEKKASDER